MLISMAVYDTVENDRTWMTQETLGFLAGTVDWEKHRLFIVDNGSCEKTLELYEWIEDELPFVLIRNDANLGTAKAVNMGWRLREPGEHCVKMDNDVVIHQAGWCDWMEDVFDRDPTIGIVGLKRKDLAESPFAKGHYKSEIRMLPHTAGQRWLVVEYVENVMGTCQGYNSLLLDKIGYLIQPGLYGFDDVLASVRARLAGFERVFLHGFEIDHIDPGDSAFCAWKRKVASSDFPACNSMALLYESGVIPLYYEELYESGVIPLYYED